MYGSTGSEHFKYLWSQQLHEHSYVGECFYKVACLLKQKTILSLGGGVDLLSLWLAKEGNHVVTVDVSAAAAAKTRELAICNGVEEYLTTLVSSAEEVALESESFDVVLTQRALHHMDVVRTVGRVYKWLTSGGIFLAEEPICLLRTLQWLHKKVPFHPSAPRTPDERELSEDDLALIRRMFSQVRVSYFDCLTRESVAYFLCKARMDWFLNSLGRIDHFLINQGLPILRGLGTYAIIEATK